MEPSEWQDITPADYEICVQYDGPAANGEVIRLYCLAEVRGRYIIIQIIGSNQKLILCEVVVIQGRSFSRGGLILTEYTCVIDIARIL